MPKGFLGGGQIGYNWQSGALVYGLEADFDLAHLTDNTINGSLTNNGVPLAASVNSTLTEKLSSLGTLRARLGYIATTDLMVYATGGLAVGSVSSSAVTTFNPGSPTSTYSGSTSSTKTGWTLGAGFEYAMTRQWSFKTEYLYVNLAGAGYTASPLAPSPPFTIGHSADHLSANLLRMGINYKF